MNNDKIHSSSPQLFHAANRSGAALRQLAMYFAQKYELENIQSMYLAAHYIECIPAQVEANTSIQDALLEVVNTIKSQEKYQDNE